jgi:predicted permease
MHAFLQDVRYSVRDLLKNPGFALVALMTLALGIGANAAMFSVIDAVLLRPLPFPDPNQLVAITTADITRNNEVRPVSYPTFLDWQAQSRSFQNLSAWHLDDFTLTTRNESVHVTGAVVSANFFSTLGVNPFLGRGFKPSEDQPGPDSIPVVLSYPIWQSHFGGDRNILGQTVTLNSESFTVVGVMPSGFQFPVQPDPIDFWAPIAVDAQTRAGGVPFTTQRGVSYLYVLGRLKPKVKLQQGLLDLNTIQQGLNVAYPENRPRSVIVNSEVDEVVGDMRTPLIFLFGAVTLVLMIACANVANLLLVRSTSRHREIAVRFALGASRTAITRQLLTESVVLSVLGGLLGLALAASVSTVLRFAPRELARAAGAAIDLRVFGFTLAVAVLTGIFFGLFPVVQNWHGGLSQTINESGRGGSGNRKNSRVRSGIIIAEVALAMILLSGAGLLMQSLIRLRNVNPGFSADHAITFGINLPAKYEGVQRAQFYDRLLERIKTLPGVRMTGAVRGLPLGPDQDQVVSTFEIEGHPVGESEKPLAGLRVSSSGYLQTMGIRLISGREFTLHDDEKATPVAIINQTLAHRYIGDGDPVGRRIQLGTNIGAGTPMLTIVGVAGDVKYGGLSVASTPEVYLPESQVMVATMAIVVRTSVDPETTVALLRDQVRSLDKEVPLRDVKTLEGYLSDSVAAPRFDTLLLGIFAAVALVLTSVGLYGVVSYSVAQRTREIGIRVALGAQRHDISRMVIKQGIILGAVGAAAGWAGAFALKRLISSWLYGVGSGDVMVLVGVAFLLVGIAFCASYVPALRATRVDPIIALRQE